MVKVELKYAIEMSTCQSVMICGMLGMLKSYVDNSTSLEKVSQRCICQILCSQLLGLAQTALSSFISFLRKDVFTD